MFAKRVWFVTAFTISLQMVAASATRADTKEQAYKAVQSAYAGMDAALNSKDINTFYSFCTRDAVSISERGERKSVEEARNELSPMLKNPNVKSIKCISTIEKFILDGDIATVFGKATMTMVAVDPQTGANNVGAANSRSLDTWVKQNGGWLMKQSETLTYEATINGNPVPQETQPGLAQQNIPPTRTLKSQQPGNNQLSPELFKDTVSKFSNTMSPEEQEADKRVGKEWLDTLAESQASGTQPGNDQLSSPIPVKPQSLQRASESGKPKEVRAIQFQNFTSPQGRFTVSIPLGWEFQAGAPDEHIIGFTPKGQGLPMIGIAYTEASLYALMMGMQDTTKISSRQWSAKDFLQQLLFPRFIKTTIPDLRVESITASSLSAAEAIASGTLQGQRIQGKIVCTMSYLQDPTQAPMGGWGYSFAYINFIIATPGEILNVEPIATSIFQSFRPTERWMGEVLDPIYRGMEVRQGMISGTMSRINGMEMQQRMSEMQSTTNIGKKWVDTVGGMTTLTNPGTGESSRVDDNYKFYYQEGNHTYGTNDYKQLNQLGRTPLQRQR